MRNAAFDFSREIEQCAALDIDWSKIDHKRMMITGATGMVGKYLIQVLLYRNAHYDAGIKIYAVGRDEAKFRSRFGEEACSAGLSFFKADVQKPMDCPERLDYVIHMASNTHPRLYASDPIGTEMSNILGAYYLLNMVSGMPGCRFLFTSSGDVYGDNQSGKPYLDEKDCGYIDCNTLRAGYIEGKRASEALCNAFREAKGVDFVTARLCRIYGSTMQLTDSKAISQFIVKATHGEDIILKSEGKQTFSYLYIYDIVSALLYVLTKGESGSAYNIADKDQTPSLRELAQKLADVAGSRVIFDLPDELETKGASTFQDVRLDPSKLCALGWQPAVTMEEGLRHTVEVFRSALTNG